MRPVLELHDVTRRFAGVTALDSVNLSLQAGERHAIIGPNGAGKSTMLKVISSELAPSSGRVTFAGRDVTGQGPAAIARMGISRTFQTSGYFAEDRALDNVMLARLARESQGRWGTWRSFDRLATVRTRALEALSLVGLEDRAEDRADSLSHGEHRQLEIAMALVQEPEVLLADEPLAGLAAAEREHIAKLLQGLDRSLTIVVVEHDLDFALDIADTTTVLHLGRVLLQGTPQDVRDDEDVDRIYTGGQALDEVKPVRADAATSVPVLRVRDMTAGYDAATVLHGLDMVVGRGEVVGLLGRNGMGKSTTLNAIMGLVAPTSGAVELDGTDVTSASPLVRARAGVGLVPQGRRILEGLTVQEQLLLGARPGHWDLAMVYEMFPNLAERRALQGTALSGGEQQMLALTRVLMRNPALVLLDEPSEGLSPLMVATVRDVLLRLSELGETVLLAEQNVPLALSVSDRVYVLDRGTIVFEGRPTELRDDPRLLGQVLGVRA